MDRLDVVRCEATPWIGGDEHGGHLGQPHHDRRFAAGDLVDRAEHVLAIRTSGNG